MNKIVCKALVAALVGLLWGGVAEGQITVGGGGGGSVTLSQPASGATTLTGTAPKGVTVTIYKNGTSVGTAVANTSTGVWTYTLGSSASGGDVYLATAPLGALVTVVASCSNSLDFSQACNSASLGALGL